MRDQSASGVPAPTEKRLVDEDAPSIAGISVREDDIEPVKGLRTIAVLFRGMAILLIVLMLLQVVFAILSTVPVSVGVVLADAVRLLIFAGLLWALGDLAVLWVKTHYDLRATRILNARILSVLQTQRGDGRIP